MRAPSADSFDSKIHGFYVKRVKRQLELSPTENVLRNKICNEKWKRENAVYSYSIGIQ